MRSSSSGRLTLTTLNPVVGAGEAVPAEQQPGVAEHVADGRAVRHQLLGQAGEQLLQRQLAAGEQGVDVTALRRAAPRLGARRASASRSTTVTSG